MRGRSWVSPKMLCDRNSGVDQSYSTADVRDEDYQQCYIADTKLLIGASGILFFPPRRESVSRSPGLGNLDRPDKDVEPCVDLYISCS